MKLRWLVAGIVVVVLGLWGATMLQMHAAAEPAPTTTKVTRAPATTTTTTDPYAELRKSLNDYCGAKGLGSALITIHDGAPIGDCTGR